jgi:hypothetical protein
MSRAPSTFRESDVKRLVRAAEAAGKRVTHLKMDENGVIDLTLADNDAANKRNGRSTHTTDDNHTTDDSDDNTNPWDEVDLK